MRPPPRRSRLRHAALACVAGALALGTATPPATPPATAAAAPAGAALAGTARSAPTATRSGSLPTVGPLYFPSVLGILPILGGNHHCSASVVHSPGHDLIVTAAHCVTGSGIGIEFVPGYDNGRLPYGSWSVRRAYVDPSWPARRDPQHDYAFLQVTHQYWHGALHGIEDVVGANVLGTAPAQGARITADGYVFGSNDRPLTCGTSVYDTKGYPSFDCGGFAGGTSGGPWLTGTGTTAHLVGLIGGLHHGGCLPSTSYSPAFGPDTRRAWQRAAAGGTGDVVPPGGSDGC